MKYIFKIHKGIKPVLHATTKTCKTCGYKNALNYTYCYECGAYLSK